MTEEDDRNERLERDTYQEELAPGEDLPTSAGGTRPYAPDLDTDARVVDGLFDELVSTVIDRHIDAFKLSLKKSVHEILDEISNQAFRDRQAMVELQKRVEKLERNQPAPDDGQ